MQNTIHTQPTGRLRTAFSFTAGIAATLAAGITLSAVVAGAANVPRDDASSFVAVTPCRLMDTRPGSDNVGPRATPLGADETHVQQVTGSNGNCTVPADATAVALNATAVGGTIQSYLTFFPGDAARPLSSNLNFGPGQAPTPNKVDVDLSDSGSIGIYNAFGTVHVVVDVMGYYVPDPQSFAVTAHSDGQTLSGDAETIVALNLTAPSDGAVVVSSFAEFGTLAGGRIDCSISDTLAFDTDHRQVWRTDSGGPGSTAGARTFAISAGQTMWVSLVCDLVSGTAGVNEADISAIFVPALVESQVAAEAG